MQKFNYPTAKNQPMRRTYDFSISKAEKEVAKAYKADINAKLRQHYGRKRCGKLNEPNKQLSSPIRLCW